MRLIDADIAIDALDKTCDRVCEYPKKQRAVMCRSCPLAHAFDVIEELPAIDAVEVVRCKDCKHWYSDADSGMACEFTNMSQPEDGFCNWAERREDG